MKITKNRLTRGLAVGLAVVTIVGTFAIFTDRYQSSATAKAGSLDLKLDQSWATDAGNVETLKHFVPGDILDLEYTLTNDSTLAAKVRETFVISSNKEIPADTFRIYKASDLQKDANTGIWSVKDGKNPVGALTEKAWDAEAGIMYTTYKLPQFVLDGTHADQQNKATATPNTDANAADKQVYANTDAADHYVILFNKNAQASVAGAVIGVEYLAEAMQHSGTGDADVTAVWENVAEAAVTITGAEKAVPVLTFDPMIP